MATTLLVTLTLSGCWASGADDQGDSTTTPGSGAPSASSEAPTIASYAALGDSYTAAPFVPVTNLAEGCLRSNGNYPSLLAAELGISELRDVSCSAAETTDIEQAQRVAGRRGSVPPQIRAVESDTDLVTVGIGGNDEDLFATLLGCIEGFSLASPDQGANAPTRQGCRPSAGPTEVIARTGDRVQQVLRAVARRAPRAEVLLVGYPRLLGATQGCPAFPIDEAEVPAARALEQALRDALARAARRADATFLDTYEVSAGHEICSDDPWVNGRRTEQSRALAFHPFAEGQQAIAEALAVELEQGRPVAGR